MRTRQVGLRNTTPHHSSSRHTVRPSKKVLAEAKVESFFSGSRLIFSLSRYSSIWLWRYPSVFEIEWMSCFALRLRRHQRVGRENPWSLSSYYPFILVFRRQMDLGWVCDRTARRWVVLSWRNRSARRVHRPFWVWCIVTVLRRWTIAVGMFLGPSKASWY